MAGLIPFNRYGLSTRFDNDLVNMLDDFFSDYTRPARNLLHDSFKMDIAEDDMAYHVSAELPGVKKDEIELNLDNGRLTIAVTREENIENDEDNHFLHRERRYSSMKRSVYLQGAKEDEISAKLEEGILMVTIPKAAVDVKTGKRIEIK